MWQVQILARLWCKNCKVYHESWELALPLPWVPDRVTAQEHAKEVYPKNQDRVRVWHHAMEAVNE